MVLYTIVPEEFIFAEGDEREQANPSLEVEVKLGQVSFLGHPLPNGRFQISRMISSNSQDYLNPQWQPGMIL